MPSFAYLFCENNIRGKLNIERLNKDGIPPGAAWGEIQKANNIYLDDNRKIIATDYLLEPRTPRKVIIAGDNDTPSLLAEKSASIDVLVHEATYTDAIAQKVGQGPQHSSAKLVAEFAESSAIKNLILMHFSSRFQDGDSASPSINDIENEARAHYSGNLFLANDLDVYTLDTTGYLNKR